MDRLRSFKNGEMIVDEDDLLPRVKDDRFNLFDAGDIRVNENVVLSTLHTIFVREHNRMVKVIKKINQFLSDDQLFQGGRNYVIALLQKITFKDFLPIMIGPKAYSEMIGEYKEYNSSVNPNIAN